MYFFRRKERSNGSGHGALAAAAPEESPESVFLSRFEPVCRAWQPRIIRMAEELNSTSKDTENDFLTLGESLQFFSKGCSENSSRASSIVKTVEDGAGFNIAGFKSLFESAHNKAGSCVALISNGIADMINLKAKTDSILELKAFLKKLAHSISVLGTLMKIETARVRQDEFNVMTSVVDDLAREIEQENNEMETSVKAARSRLTASGEKMSSSIEKFSADLAAGKGHVQGILEEMDRMIMQSKWACSRIEGRAAQISPEVGKVVSALQCHDICRQQMEHVGDVLKDIAAKASILHTLEENEKILFARWTADALRVQISQLGHVIEVTAKSSEEISSHLSRISDLTGAQAEEAALILEEEESGGNRIARIGSELESLSRMLEENRTMVMDMGNAISEATAALGELSRRVANLEMISENINLLALNTIVKVARTGNEGRGLEVLAGEIRKLSVHAKDEISKGALIIKGILADSTEFRETLAGKLEGELSGTEEIFRQTRSAVQELMEADASFMKSLNEISADTKNLESDIMRLVSGTNFDTIIKERLGRTISELRAMLEEIGYDIPAVEGLDAPGKPQGFDDLVSRYTMHSEREVHEAALGSAKGNGNGSSMECVAAGSDLGDNVELF